MCKAYLYGHYLTIVKFIYSENATNLSEISTIDLSYVVTVKYTVEILQNFVVSSEYKNFNKISKTSVQIARRIDNDFDIYSNISHQMMIQLTPIVSTSKSK